MAASRNPTNGELLARIDERTLHTSTRLADLDRKIDAYIRSHEHAHDRIEADLLARAATSANVDWLKRIAFIFFTAAAGSVATLIAMAVGKA